LALFCIESTFLCAVKKVFGAKSSWYLCWLYAYIFFWLCRTGCFVLDWTTRATSVIQATAVENLSVAAITTRCGVSIWVPAADTCCKIRSVHGVNAVLCSVWNIQLLCISHVTESNFHVAIIEYWSFYHIAISGKENVKLFSYNKKTEHLNTIEQYMNV